MQWIWVSCYSQTLVIYVVIANGMLIGIECNINTSNGRIVKISIMFKSYPNQYVLIYCIN